MRKLVAALAGLAAVWASCPPAGASGHHLPQITGPTDAMALGTSDGDNYTGWPYQSDYRRWLAFSHGGHLRIFDMRKRSYYDLDDCGLPFAWGGRDRFLTSCGTGGGAAWTVLYAHDRKLVRVPGTIDHDSFDEIGADWLVGVTCSDPGDDHSCVGLMLNWHTGRRYLCYEDDGGYCPPFDLDRPDLAITPRPRRRPPGTSHWTVGVERPYVLDLILHERKLAYQRGRLVLHTPKGRLILARGLFCADEDCSPTLAGGWVTWFNGNWKRPAAILHAYRIRDGKSYTWQIRDGNHFTEDDLGSDPRVDGFHTPYGIVFRVIPRSKLRSPEFIEGDYRFFFLPLP